ncbi:1700001K19Rik [Phodopus roborovskii]|uniref:1700001K19Rik protein n=2 Tax=Phodopus roborovskii TaxID=109678 RepID=A0AAU9ZSV8_PHORO|nr:1700001K19Rik [Phodopus roborovskii]
MASLRPSRPTCIKAAFSAAGFRKWQRQARHRLQVSSRRNLMDFAEGIWREFLDPYDGDSEDTPGHSTYRNYRQRAYRLLGDRNRNAPSYTLRFKIAEETSVEDLLSPKAPDLTTKTSGWVPIALEVNDVDMQPEGELKAHGPQEVNGWPNRLSPPPEDWRMTRAANPLIPVERAETSRHLPSRARATRPPRLGNERDKGPRLSLSKRKLELLLSEPERTKKKKK